MKHIIEKHVTISATCSVCSEEILLYTRIESHHFPALISDLEEEMCKFAEWARWQDDSYKIKDLLKIYKDINKKK